MPLNLNNIKTIMTLMALLLSVGCLQAKDDSVRVFNERHPLVYEDKWDMWPYAFLDGGEPKGFNIDLVKMLMEELDIPYVIKLKPGREVRADVLSGEADMTFGLADDLNKCFTTYSKSVVQLFTHSVVSLKKHPTTIHSLQDLSKEKVVVYDNSCTHRLMKDKGWDENAIPYVDMKEAMLDILEKKDGQIIWNTASLEWLMRIYDSKDLQISDFKMPVSKYRMISPNLQLLDRLDSAFVALSANGRITEIENKWFYPDRQETGIPQWAWYVAAIAVIIVLIMAFYALSYRIQERRLIGVRQTRAHQLRLLLESSKVGIWTFDIATQTFAKVGRNGQQTHLQNLLDAAQYFEPDKFEEFCKALKQLADMETTKVEVELTTKKGRPFSEENKLLVTLSVLQWKKGRPATIIGSLQNVTLLHGQQRETEQQLLRYQTVFNTALADMVFYDQDGYLVDMNARAERTFKVTQEEALQRHMNFYETLGLDKNEVANMPYMHFTQLLYANEHEGWKSWRKGIMRYEILLVPARTHSGRLLGYYGSGRDMTSTAATYQHVQEGIRQLQNATRTVAEYVENINYVMGVGNVRLVSYSPETHMLTLYRNVDKVQRQLTQSRCMTLVADEWKKKVLHVFDNMDARTPRPIAVTLRTTIKQKNTPMYLQFQFVPNYDKDGHVTDYFGQCRDQSEIEHTRLLLEKETEKAKNVENLKNAFLHNMSFEIRTPLATVVGFADLFRQEHTHEEETVFIGEIKKNSTRLLELINDILFISRLDAHMIEINRQPTDFAKTFDGHCTLAWEERRREGVNYMIENPYKTLVIDDLDDANVGRIMEQIIINAVQHTERGYVKARYDYIAGKLVIAITDTGSGMSAELMSHIYERFATGKSDGTGLGLPICKELAEQLGGEIQVSSVEGKGTTAWITLPCTVSDIERKDETA